MPKPHETDSSAIGPPSGEQDKAEFEITRNDTGTATGSHQRPAEDVPSNFDDSADEYILEREPDGRYRIAGRRSRKQE